MGDTVAGSGGREGELVGRLYRELKQNQVSPAQYYQQYHALKLVPGNAVCMARQVLVRVGCC